MRNRHATRLALIPAAALALPGARAGAGVSVADLEVNGAAEPLGIDDRAPRLSWRLAEPGRGIPPDGVPRGGLDRRASARAERGRRLGLGARRVRRPVGDLRGTGARVPHAVLLDRARLDGCGGPRARRRGPVSFETAYLDAGEWKGAWIAGPERTRRAHAGSGRRGRRGDPRGGRVLPAARVDRPKDFAADRFPNDQGECRELRPAPMFRRRSRSRSPSPAHALYSSGLAYHALTLNERVRLRPRARSGLHRLLEDGALHRWTT